jgi:hypothetical protein
MLGVLWFSAVTGLFMETCLQHENVVVEEKD